MAEKLPREAKVRQAKVDYEVLEARIAPFVIRKRIKATHSTAGEWGIPAPSTTMGVCLPGERRPREL